MPFSRLSDEEAREIREAASDPAYREMNRIEAGLHERLAGTSPLENFERFLVWLELLSNFAPRLEPSRDVPRSDIALL